MSERSMDYKVLHPGNVLEDSLKIAFRLDEYLSIMEDVAQQNFMATSDFQKRFNSYYRIRQRSRAWYDTYYRIMEEQRQKNRTYKEVLNALYEVSGNIEVSFASKLLATCNPELPIWDKYVLNNLDLQNEWGKKARLEKEEKIDLAVKIYDEICSWYNEFLNSQEGEECLTILDAALPHYKDKLSRVKKVDFLLWSKRQ